MGGTETSSHIQLKRLAACWALDHGFDAVAMEVRLPESAYRTDVAAYRRQNRGGQPALGITAVFECKQARADFLKDSYARAETAERLRQLDGRRATLERLLKMHLPSLRRGESLFEEFDTIDAEALEHR